MNTKQINKALQQHKHNFLGVFACDKIPSHPIANTCFVANTDPHNLPGTHWVAFYISQSRRAYYFDSFGFPPLNVEFKAFLNETGYKWCYNKRKLQTLTSDNCGHHCVYFLQTTCRTRNPARTVQAMSRQSRFNDKMVFQQTQILLKNI